MKYLFDDSDELPDLNIDDLSGIESTFNCPDCAKLYKTTKSGLSRHYKTKHVMTETSSKLSCEKLQAIIEEAAKKLSEDFCFAENTRSSFSSFSISSEEVTVLWGSIHSIFDKKMRKSFIQLFMGLFSQIVCSCFQA